uniref:Nucleotidyltransferase n=1 Tax=viral metagenome TaxID=1070528 RepID=A0A6M3JH41_9ZZZZ
MITGFRSMQDLILEEFKRSEIKFKLTGSRYFGCPREDSDYDFFTEYTPKTAIWLEQLGFTSGRTLAKRTYDDIATEVVYAHIRGNIHVQLVKPAMIKAKGIAQEIFKSMGYLRPSKRDWDGALTIIKTMFAI